MNKKILIALSLIAGHSFAMDLENTINQATPGNENKDAVFVIDGQEITLPALHIRLIGSLQDARETFEGNEKEEDNPIPLPPVSLATWQHVEDQLGRVYAITQGNNEVRDAIIADYSKLDNAILIDLIKTVNFLNIEQLMQITLVLAQEKLTMYEILALPESLRNIIIKNMVIRSAGPMPGKQHAVCRGHEVFIRVLGSTNDKIISGSGDSTIRIWDMNGNEHAVCRGHNSGVNTVCVTTNDMIVSGSDDKTIRIWDMNGQQLAVYTGHESYIHSVCVTPDGRIVSGSSDKTIRIWNMNGQQDVICKGHEGAVWEVCLTPNGQNIVSLSNDKTIRIWDMNGRQLAVCRGHEDLINSVDVTPDGKNIVSGSHDKTIRIWDMNGRQLAVCRGHEDVVNSVCVTPDGKIVSGSDDKTIRIWDMTGQQLAVCSHNNNIWPVRVTPGEIVAGSMDGTISIWNMNGQLLAVCNEHDVPFFQDICVTPNGKIISAHVDTTVRIWDCNLLHRLSAMNKKTAEAIYELLKSVNVSERIPSFDSQKLWEGIDTIFAEEELAAETKKRKKPETGKNSDNSGTQLLEDINNH